MKFPNFYFKRRKRPSYLKIRTSSSGVNLFDKSKVQLESIKNETPTEAWGYTVYFNDVLGTILQPNKRYKVSYDYECTAVPNSMTIKSNNLGFIFYSTTNIDVFPSISVAKTHQVSVGETGHYEKIIDIPETFNGEGSNYRMLCYTNRYVDESGNNHMSSVIFRNIRIVEV